MSAEIEEAINVLKAAFKDDQEFADVWHDNIAMCMFDGIGSDNTLTGYEMHNMANRGASNFMKLAFNIKTLIPNVRK